MKATTCELRVIIHHLLIYQCSYFSCYLCLSPCTFLSTNSKHSSYILLQRIDTLSCVFTILCFVPILPKTDNSLPFVLTVRSYDTCDKSINSPLPKRHKHIITRLHDSNSGTNDRPNQTTPTSYEVLHNFVRTSPRLCTNFAQTPYMYYIHTPHNFVLTSPQLCMNYA